MNETVSSYLLDFDLASKRAIGNDNQRYRLFQLYFLEGRTAEYCCEELSMERFTLAAEVTKIENLAGQSFTQRGLFPLAQYFGQSTSATSERLAA